MKLHFIAWVLPVLITIIAIPLVIGMIPPNNWYGFRTPKTLSSPAIWYAANRAMGWFFIGAGLLTMGFNLALWLTHPGWPEAELGFWMVNVVGIGLVLALIPSFLYLRGL
jgi:hypothetical protein